MHQVCEYIKYTENFRRDRKSKEDPNYFISKKSIITYQTEIQTIPTCQISAAQQAIHSKFVRMTLHFVIYMFLKALK